MGKPKAPKAPNMTRFYDIMEKQLKQNDSMYKEYMDFSRTAYADQKGKSDLMFGESFDQAQKQNDFADTMRNRYLTDGIKQEDRYASQLRDWDSPERMGEASAAAGADVTKAFEAARTNQLRSLQAYGIDPSQVRSGALDQQMRTDQAVAAAGASTQARRQVEKEGIAFEGEAANIYKGMPAQTTQLAGSGAAIGAGGLQGTGQTAQLGQGMYGTGAGILGQGSQMLNAGYGTANNVYGNQLQAYDIKMANSPLNTIAGLAGAWMGGGMPGIPFEDGGYVDPSMSPSGGRVTDDVQARVNVGEVIIPDEVVRYHGLKVFNKLAKEAGVTLGTGIPEEAR